MKLSEHNKSRDQSYRDRTGPRPNGIECDKCGGELVDSNPNVMLASCPPQMDVHCPACGFSGYRTV